RELLARCSLTCGEPRIGPAPRPRRRVRIQDHTAGDRCSATGLADDEAIVHVEHERDRESDANVCALLRIELRSAVEADPDVALGRARVELEGAARGQGSLETPEGTESCLEH